MAGTDLIYEIPANIKTPGGELQNTRFWMLQSNPTTLLEGLPWWDSVNHKPVYYDGTAVREYGRIYTQGTGIAISAQNVISVNLSASDIPNITLSKISDVTASASELNILDGATLTTTELNYVDGVTSPIQTQLNNKLTKNTAITGATKCKITYDANGLVTSGGDLVAGDIPDLSSTYLATTLKGANNGLAELGADGKVPSSQLPAFVDDVVELLTMGSAPSTCATGDKYYNSTSKKIFTATATNTWGTTGVNPVKDVIYVRIDTNGSYRWSGSDMINISNPISSATESTAGIAEIATNSEVSTGTDDARIVTPKKLATYYQKKLTFGTGLTDTSNTITVTDYDKLLKNIAVGNNSITIGDVLSDKNYSINIGSSSQIGGDYGVAIGNSAKAYGYAVGLGYHAEATDNSAIQIGYGTNNTANSLSIGFYNNSTTHYKWTLLDGTTGLIPNDRISPTIINGASKGATSVQKYVVNNTAITAVSQ